MFLTFQYKILPTRAQHAALEGILEGQRLLCNGALQERRDAWRLSKTRISFFDQSKSLTEIRADPALGYGSLPANLSRWTLKKVHLSMEAFFDRFKSKRSNAGYPRFKSKSRWSSFGFAEWAGVRLVAGPNPKIARLLFKGMPAALRISMHRPIPAGAKLCSCVFTKDGSRWTISIQVGVPDFVGPHTHAGRQVGGDSGILNLMTLSDGAIVPNPRVTKEFAAEQRRRQRALSRCKRGSKRRRKQVALLSAQQRRAKNKRRTHLHQQSARLTRDYGLIVVEDLRLKNMTASARGTLAAPGSNVRQKTGLNRGLLDAGIGIFISQLTYKAESAGGRLIKVNPRGTSIDCSDCGEPVRKTLATRTHRCVCGLVLDRDINAARNILLRARAVAGTWGANVDRIAA